MVLLTRWLSASRGAIGPYLAINRDAANLAVHATGGLAVHANGSLAVHLPGGLAVHATDGLAVHLPGTRAVPLARKRAALSLSDLLLAVLLWAMAPQASGQAPRAVRIDLYSDRILAGDLAAVLPPFAAAEPVTVLGYAPLPGVERRIARDELVRWGGALGLALDVSSLPQAVIVARPMRRLEAAQVRDLVVEAVAARYRVDPAQVEVELHGFSEPLLPAGALEFELASPLKKLGRPATLTLRWTDPQGHSGSLSFRATARVRGTYAVARAALVARTEVTPGDVVFEEGFLPGDPDEYALSSQDVEGKKLKQSMRPGEALGKRMLEDVPAVERGELIELQLRSQAVVLRAAARAEQTGSPGQVIRCRNLQSGATVRARILDSRQAEVIR